MAKKNKIGGNRRIRKSSKINVTKWKGQMSGEKFICISKWSDLVIIKLKPC